MKDLDDVPQEVIQQLHFVPVERMDDVIRIALHAPLLSLAAEEGEVAEAKPVERRKRKKI